MTKKVLEVRSRNVESAIEEGLQYLGLNKEEVAVKVLERPAKIVGFSSEAVVWLVYEPVEQSSTVTVAESGTDSSSSDAGDSISAASNYDVNTDDTSGNLQNENKTDTGDKDISYGTSGISGESVSSASQRSDPAVSEEVSLSEKTVTEDKRNIKPLTMEDDKENPVTG